MTLRAAPNYTRELFGDRDFSKLSLKPDHHLRPIWVCPDHHIFLETFSPIYRQAYDFLVAIAEPVSRPAIMHEYMLTPHSLYAAVSVGLEMDDIIRVLDKLSKVKLSEDTIDFVRACTSSYGKVKLVLHHNRYFVESTKAQVLQTLLKEPVIRGARISNTTVRDTMFTIDEQTGFLLRTLSNHDESILSSLRSASESSSSSSSKPQASSSTPSSLAPSSATSTTTTKTPSTTTAAAVVATDHSDDSDNGNDDDDDDSLFGIGGGGLGGIHKVYAFEVQAKCVEDVKRRCIEIDYPTLEEYDFRNDTQNPNLDIDLKPTTKIRSYQEKSLSKMFGNGRTRSGIIVLPCGAGKTLAGIVAACTVKKSTLVLCTSSVSVEQWRNQFKLWSNVDDKSIARFTSTTKERAATDAQIVITTYTMVAFSGHRSDESSRLYEHLKSREWGLLILDEVHVVPAQMFRKVLSMIASHCKLGLSATLVREDNRTKDLNFLIGPKLYEANWLDLQRSGHLANVQCAEVWCSMTPEFYAEYSRQSASRRKLLYVMNPNKMRVCEHLIRYHEKRGDKTLVFSDNLLALKEYAITLQRPYICGPTSQAERMNVLRAFQQDATLNTIFISKVGDTSIDLPEASVIIQISSHYGSRRQEAQRLGRILRPKGLTDNNAYFYSLVSQDTQEMYYSGKRQQFLIDQGYSFRVVTDGVERADKDPAVQSLKTKQQQLQLLSKVLAADESQNIEKLPTDNDDVSVWSDKPSARRKTGSMNQLSGADDILYLEFQRSASTSSSGVGNKRGVGQDAPARIMSLQRHPLFRKRVTKKT